MKSIIILLAISAMISFTSKAQHISSDTVVCIIDTTKCYVTYRENPFAYRNQNFHWQVSIKGHYYDIVRPQNKDFACIVFSTDDLSSFYPENKGSWQIKIPKGKIKDRYITQTDEWINKQTDFSTLAARIGSMPSDKCSFIVFKQDYDTAEADSVTMHRVTVGYCEIVE